MKWIKFFLSFFFIAAPLVVAQHLADHDFIVSLIAVICFNVAVWLQYGITPRWPE